jgi:hypothetical protein
LEKNYDKALDFILEELIKASEVENKGIRFVSEEQQISLKNKIADLLKNKFNLQDWEINILYYTLLIDEHIKSIDSPTITLEGIVFHNKGGYVEATRLKTNESNRLDAIQQDFKKYAYGLMLFTAIVAAGTIVSAWFFAIEIYEYYFGVRVK